MQAYEFTIKDGRKNTDGSCAVLAIAAAAECSYQAARSAAVSIGFKPNKGTPMYNTEAEAIIKRRTGAKVDRVYDRFRDYGTDHPKTLRQFFKRYGATGNWMVSVRGHIFAVCEGKVIDNGYYIPTEEAIKHYGRRSLYRLFKVTPADHRPIEINPSPNFGKQGTQLALF